MSARIFEVIVVGGVQDVTNLVLGRSASRRRYHVSLMLCVAYGSLRVERCCVILAIPDQSLLAAEPHRFEIVDGSLDGQNRQGATGTIDAIAVGQNDMAV